MRISHRPFAALTAIVLGLTLSVAGRSPASAACGSACDGRDPQPAAGKASVCVDDADTIFEVGGVQLRYSPNCRTAWARQIGDLYWLTGVLVQSFNTNGTLRMTQTDRGTGGPWSRMVNDANLTARACFYQYDNEWDYEADRRTIRYCTGRY